ncbi:MAG: hypothetical protein HY976_00555 [Candidatus Kerfeldbacteria bacterium]|nr:hypothetical protein [Candidatus Kerfeldbacteria bacterium]
MYIVLFAISGLLVGWFASLMVSGRGFGLGGNGLIGMLGGVAAPFGLLFKGADVLESVAGVMPAVLGALVLVLVGMAFRKRPLKPESRVIWRSGHSQRVPYRGVM